MSFLGAAVIAFLASHGAAATMPNPPPPSVPPPSTLAEAWGVLDTIFADPAMGFAAVTEPQGMAIYHRELGRWMRNEWGLLAKRGALARELLSRGLRHPDDMSGALLEAYWCQRHGVVFDWPAAAEAAAAYWRSVATPAISSTPDGQPIRWLVTQHLPTGTLHGGRSPDGRTWAFDPAQPQQVVPASGAVQAAILAAVPP